jgi:hypothetical protein
MATQPQPPARPAPPQQQQPPRQAPPQQQAAPPPVNRPAQAVRPGEAPTGRATVGPAQTFPPGSRYARDIPGDGPDPQESKLRSYELGATRAQEEPVRTAAQEQRERSAEYEERGVEVVKAESDTRDPRDRQRTVPGVSRTQVDADEVDRVQRRP